MSQPKTIADIIASYDSETAEKTASVKVDGLDEIEKLASELGLTQSQDNEENKQTSASPEATNTKEASVSVSNFMQNMFPVESASGAEQEKVAAAMESAMGKYAFDVSEAIIDCEIEKIAAALVEEHGDHSDPHPQQFETNEDKSGKPLSVKNVHVPEFTIGDEGQVGEIKKAAYAKQLLLAQLENDDE